MRHPETPETPPCNPDSESQYAARAQALRAVREAEVPVVVAGAYAMREYAGIIRDTKDLDIFCRRQDVERVLEALAETGFRTEITDPVWLAKGFHPCGEFVDVIFSSGNGVADVDDDWFTYARPTEVLGVPALVAPPEEIIWSKGFVLERERYDGADVNHMLRYCADFMDWKRLYARFEPHPEVLLSHLLLFKFAYPGLRDKIPTWLFDALVERSRAPAEPGTEKLCRGTILSRCQYDYDLHHEGMEDARSIEVESFRDHQHSLH